MKKRTIVICALVLALVLALFALTACNNASSEIGEELVVNGKFTDFNNEKFDGWSTSTSSSMKYGKNEPSGDENNESCLYIDNSSRVFSYLYQSVKVDRNNVYKVSWQVCVPGASDYKLNNDKGAYLTFLENSAGYQFGQQVVSTNGKFVTKTVYVRPKNTDYLTVALCLGTATEGCTGRVLFDNVTISRIDKNSVPEGEQIINFTKARSIKTASTASGICFVVLLALFTVALAVTAYLVIRRIYARRDAFADFSNPVVPSGKKGGAASRGKWYQNAVVIAVGLMLGAFLVRLILLLTTYGMGSSMSALITNARALGLKNGVTGFFAKNSGSLMAPGSMYILAVLGAIGVRLDNASLSILIRFVNVLADMAVVAMIYFYGRKYVGNKLSTVYAALYAFLPFVFVMSGINGTFESVLLALMLGAVILMVEKKYLPTYLVLTLAAVLDLRAMAIAPIVVAYFVYRYIKDEDSLRKFTANRAMIVFGLVGSFVLAYVLTLPVGINQIAAGDAFFNFKMIVRQMTGNNYFVRNAFNLYGMVAMNGKTISQNGVTILNLVFLLVLEAYVISLYFKNRNKQELILLASFTLAVISVFTLKVDYTYLFLSIAFALIYTMISGDKRMYCITAGYSLLGFLDIAQLLNQSKLIGTGATTNIVDYETTNPFYIIFCVLTVLLTAYYVYVTYSITNNDKIVDIKAMPESVFKTMKNGFKNLGEKMKRKQAE